MGTGYENKRLTVFPDDDLASILNELTSYTDVYLTEGTHTLNAQVVITGKDNITIRGAGNATNIDVSGLAVVPFWIGAGTDRLEIGHLKITSTVDHGFLKIDPASGGTCNHHFIHHIWAATSGAATGTAVFIDYYVQAAVAKALNHIRIEDVHDADRNFKGDCLVRIRNEGGQGVNMVWVKNCVVRNASSSVGAVGWAIDIANTSQRVWQAHVEGNEFERFGGGIRVVGADQVTVNDNSLTTCGANGGILLDGCDKSTCSGNTMRDLSSSGNAIEIDDSDRCVVSDNHINDGLIGVFLDSSVHCVVTGNNIYSTAGDGIEVSSSAESLIAANEVRDAGTRGIDINSTSPRCSVNTNVVDAATAEGIYSEAADTQIDGNHVISCADGIVLVSVSGPTITSNHVQNSSDDGITLTGVSNATINDNSIHDCTGTGLLEDATSDGNRIGSNKLYSNGTDYDLQGTNRDTDIETDDASTIAENELIAFETAGTGRRAKPVGLTLDEADIAEGAHLVREGGAIVGDLNIRTFFVATEAELDDAVAFCSANDGGIIYLTADISLTEDKCWDLTGITIFGSPIGQYGAASPVRIDFNGYTITSIGADFHWQDVVLNGTLSNPSGNPSETLFLAATYGCGSLSSSSPSGVDEYVGRTMQFIRCQFRNCIGGTSGGNVIDLDGLNDGIDYDKFVTVRFEMCTQHTDSYSPANALYGLSVNFGDTGGNNDFKIETGYLIIKDCQEGSWGGRSNFAARRTGTGPLYVWTDDSCQLIERTGVSSWVNAFGARPIQSDNDSSYLVRADDAGKIVLLGYSGNQTVQLWAKNSAAHNFIEGVFVDLLKTTTGTISFSVASGVTLYWNGVSYTNETVSIGTWQNRWLRLICTADNTWVLAPVDVDPERDISHEPMGFQTQDDTYTTLSWVDGTTTFQIAPVGTSFDVWIQGRRFRKTAAESLVGDGTDFTIAEGLWFFYYDSTGTLTASQTMWDLSQVAPIAILYWDATNSKALLGGLFDERHGVVMDWATHEYLHVTRGTQYSSGLGLTITLEGDGDVDADAQVAVSNGVIYDEDIEISITDGAGAGRFVQELDPTAQIPVLYKDGASGNWREITAGDYPIIYGQVGTGRAEYNNPDAGGAGVWGLTEVPDGDFMDIILIGTNSYNQPIAAICGQTTYATIFAAAVADPISSLDLSNLPFQEVRYLYRLVVQTDDGYTNVPQSRFRGPGFADYRTVDLGSPAGTTLPTDHQTLSNRDATGAHPAAAIAVDTTNLLGNLQGVADDGQSMFEAIDGLALEVDANKTWEFLADMFATPNTSDWGLNSPAPIITDPTNSAIPVAAFDDTTEEGVGMEVHVPTGATKLKCVVEYRAATAPGSAQTVDFRWRFRSIPDDAAIGAWTVVDVATAVVPTNAYFQYRQYEFDLATVSLTAGLSHLFEWSRYVGGDDTLTGDLYIRAIRWYVRYDNVKWVPADSMMSALSADWSINANAPIATDSNNTALKVRLHDDTTEEGCGIEWHVPDGTAKMRLYIRSRAETAPGGAAGVGVTLHYREMANGVAIGGWVQYDLPTDVAIPTNEYWQYDNWELDMATLATPIVPGSTYQFQITRNPADAGDTLTGDWATYMYGFEWY